MTVTLARLPTPIEPLPGISKALGIEVHVKRDDLTGFGLSGNKVRKLTHLLEEARQFGADTVITTGGLQSNHCRATAVAARRMGLTPVLFLRGQPGEQLDGNLLLSTLLGAKIHYLTHDDYRHERDLRMAVYAQQLREAGRVPYVIPEGGSNPLGCQAYIDAADELGEEQFDHTFVAVGSGGTLAGLAMSSLKGQLHGVAVCDDRPFFENRVRDLAHASGRDLRASWRVDDRYRGPGYGLADGPIWQDIRLAARADGLLLDPCYTGKAFHALAEHARQGALHGRVLFWHTGGGFGLFGRGSELATHVA